MFGFFLWYLQESNQGHKDFQSFALPTELRYPANCSRKYTCFPRIDKLLGKKLLLLLHEQESALGIGHR